jgi:CubicO group peptidase (beta-lactamase class C family)
MTESSALSSLRDGFPGGVLAERYRTGFVVLQLAEGTVTSCTSHSCPDVAGLDPLRDDSIVWLGCLSKPFVAAAVLLLCDRGEVALGDPLDRLLPDLSPALRTLTIGDLLAHRGGPPHYPPGWRGFFDREWLSETLESAARRTPDPDESRGRRTYSGAGYVLLGRVIERASSMPFTVFVTRELFQPLGMTETFGIDAIPSEHAARMAPVLECTGPDVSIAFDPRTAGRIRNAMPFAGLFSTARDVARFVQMLLDRGFGGRRTLLRAETVAHMLREDVRGNGIHQALGWFLAFSSESGRGARPCGFWHTSSTGALIAANAMTRGALVILGQRLLARDLVPVRVTQWKFAESAIRLRPFADNARPAGDARDWLRELHASGGTAVTSASEATHVVRD